MRSGYQSGINLNAPVQINPVNLIGSNIYSHGSGIIGGFSYYWYSLTYSITNAWNLLFYSSELSPQNANGAKGQGFPLRCLVPLEFRPVLPTPYLQWY